MASEHVGVLGNSPLLNFGRTPELSKLSPELESIVSRIFQIIDEAFGEVIRSCAETIRPGQDGTWITREVIDAYVHLHELGISHSVEAWEGDALVGGLYGVAIDGAFSAESMFYRVSNASKLCVLHLIGHLRGRGLDWIDVQTMTPHMD